MQPCADTTPSPRSQILHRFGQRPHAVLYLGDHDPSGYDIERNAQRWFGDIFVDWVRVAIDVDVIDRYGLSENPGKESDSRAGRFIERFGRLTQVEVEALDPSVLRELIERRVTSYWDASEYAASLARENHDRALLRSLTEAHE